MKGRTSMVDFNEKKDGFINIAKFMNTKFNGLLEKLNQEKMNTLQEIRIRAGMPTVVICLNESFVLDGREFVATPDDIKEIFNLLCGYSVYSFENQIKKGFITIIYKKILVFLFFLFFKSFYTNLLCQRICSSFFISNPVPDSYILLTHTPECNTFITLLFIHAGTLNN